MLGIRTILFAAMLLALIFTHAASAQTISIVQGNGQLICDGCATGLFSFLDNLVVLVKDASGNPIGNAAVTWAVTAADQIRPPAGILNSTTTLTSSNTSAGAGLCDQIGHSCNRYSGNDTGSSTLRVMAVTAALSNGSSVTFTLTETPNPSASGSTEDNANAFVTDPATNTQFTGTAGSTSNIQIHAVVVTNGGQAIPNVSVRLIADPQNPTGSPTASCVTQAGADPGSVLTDNTGTATCSVVLGPVPSTGTPPTPVAFRVLIGGVVTPLFISNIQASAQAGLGGPVGISPLSARYQLIVTPATPNAVQIISGNNQTGNRGQAFAQPLVVQVLDASSNALQAVGVTWSVVPNSAAIVSPANTTTDSNGNASTVVTLSSTAAGSIQVTATTSNGKSVTFNNLSVNVQVSGLTIFGGNNQSVPVGQLFQPITVQVAAGGASPLGIPVQFAISGPASLAATSATADASGRAAVGVQAGLTAGPVTVTATVGNFSVTFNLTVLPPGLNLTSASFLNGAGFFATGDKNIGALSPCSIGTVVIGTPLTAATLPVTPNLFGVAMQQPSGAVVRFNAESAPILSVTGSSAQTLITFQVPCDVAPGSVPVTVTLNNASTLQPVSVTVRSASPGIFELPMSDGVRRAVAVKPDGTFVSLENRARRGEDLRIYVTGIGPTSPALTTGAVPIPGVDSMSTAYYLARQLGSGGVEVTSASRISPALLGVYEFDIHIPNDAPQGNNIFFEMGVLVTKDGDFQFANPGIGSKIPIQ